MYYLSLLFSWNKDPGDEQYGRKSRGRKGYASAAFPFSHSQTIDGKLSDTKKLMYSADLWIILLY